MVTEILAPLAVSPPQAKLQLNDALDHKFCTTNGSAGLFVDKYFVFFGKAEQKRCP